MNEYCESILKIFATTNACLDNNTVLKLQKNTQKSQVRREYYYLDYYSADSSLIGRFNAVLGVYLFHGFKKTGEIKHG